MKTSFLVTLRRNLPLVIVVCVSLAMTLVNSQVFFRGLLVRPPDTVFLGTTHYFEDYFVYLSNFFQGAHGAWLTANRFTSEVTSPSIIYWSDVLMGKLGGLVGLKPIYSYNISVILLSFVTLLTSYAVLRMLFRKQPGVALIAFLYATFSTSFMNRVTENGRTFWYPWELWKTPHYAFDRLGSVPHQLMQTLLFLLLVYVYFSHPSTKLRRRLYFLLAVVFALALASINPVPAVMFVAALLATAVFSAVSRFLCEYLHKKGLRASLFPWISGKTDWLLIVSVSIAVGAMSYCLYAILNTPPHNYARIWDAQQHMVTFWTFTLLSMGPVAFLALAGIVPFLYYKRSPVAWFSVVLVLSSYTLFHTQIPTQLGVSQFRVLFPALYTFIGAFAGETTYAVAKGITKKLRTVSQALVMGGIVVLVMLVMLPTLVWEVKQRFLETNDTSSVLRYIPQSVYRGFVKLQALGTYDDVVLANTYSYMDTLVPSLSGHTTYSGHMLLTINSADKSNDSGIFFILQVPQADAARWLRDRHIRYVLFTAYDGGITRFRATYPSLIPRYENAQVTVFEVPTE